MMECSLLSSLRFFSFRRPLLYGSACILFYFSYCIRICIVIEEESIVVGLIRDGTLRNNIIIRRTYLFCSVIYSRRKKESLDLRRQRGHFISSAHFRHTTMKCNLVLYLIKSSVVSSHCLFSSKISIIKFSVFQFCCLYLYNMISKTLFIIIICTKKLS